MSRLMKKRLIKLGSRDTLIKNNSFLNTKLKIKEANYLMKESRGWKRLLLNL